MCYVQAQYLFIYDSLLHAYLHGVTEVKASQLRDHVASLATPLSEQSSMTQLDKEFDLVMSAKLNPDSHTLTATEDDNVTKNRSQHSLPCECIGWVDVGGGGLPGECIEGGRGTACLVSV
jgi:hypothetical protein